MENLTGFNSRLARNVSVYQDIAGTEDDIPEIIPSLSQGYTAYRSSAYDRSSIAYEILYDMLGYDLFVNALREYINRWKVKHPIPFDFYFTFNEVTDQNLDWFWKPWFFEIGYPDLAIGKVNVQEGKATIKIEKLGNIPIPIKLTVYYEDDSSEVIYFKADVWKNSDRTFITEIVLSGILKEIKLGDINIPDSNTENNLYLVH
jgi:aminopeptidase N